MNENSYDAIVVGTGISGGWAAKELTEKGLKTLVLDRGRMVRHVEDYPTATTDMWDFPYAGRATAEELEAPGNRGPHRLRGHAGDQALVRGRHRVPVHREAALRLDPRLSRRRPLPHVGPAELSLEPDGLRGQCQGRNRGRLADPL